MKTIRFTAFSILLGLLVLVSACKKETNPATATQTGSKISVTGQDAGTGLKSTLSNQTTVWIASSDQVGIYSPTARTATGGTGDPIVNAPFMAVTSAASSTFSGTMYWGAASTSHTFYAYYPYTPGSAASTVVPVSLATAQTQSAANNSAHIGALDFMVATPTTVTSPANTNAVANEVNLSYNHVFTLLEFNLKLASGVSTDLSSIELYSTDSNLSLTSGTIDLTQDTPSGDNSYTLVSPVGTKKVTLTTSGCTLSTEAAISAYMMILPGDQLGDGSTSSDMTIKVTSAAGVTVVVKNGMNFVRGKRYTIDLTGLTFEPALSDVDANTYRTVTIGTQVWMAENLKTTKYKNGVDAIPNVTANATWTGLSSDAYCWYNNDSGNGTTYGALYNWYAVNTGNLCPTGWHVPTDANWTTLTDYLGGLYVAGGKLRETGTSHWSTTDTGVTNESVFTAFAGGARADSDDGSQKGIFVSGGDIGVWWSSTPSSDSNALARIMDNNHIFYVSSIEGPKYYGVSVRCIKE